MISGAPYETVAEFGVSATISYGAQPSQPRPTWKPVSVALASSMSDQSPS